MKNLILGFSVILMTSCSMFRANNDFMAQPEYQNRPALTKSILEDSDMDLKEAHKILNSRIVYPKKINLAVVRLNSNVTNNSFHWTKNSDTAKNKIDDNFISAFYNKLESNKNIQSVIPVPPSLIPANVNINRLRSLGLRMQAHLILVINSNSELNSDNVWSKNHKSETMAESYLIDTATGVIVTAGTYIDTALDQTTSNDMTTAEGLQRAKLESEKKVFANIANDVSLFLAKVQ